MYVQYSYGKVYIQMSFMLILLIYVYILVINGVLALYMRGALLPRDDDMDGAWEPPMIRESNTIVAPITCCIICCLQQEI